MNISFWVGVTDRPVVKATFRVLWYALLLFIAIPIACRLGNVIPYTVSAAGCLFFTIGAAWPRRHTPESSAMAEDILGALADIDMQEKEAAYRQDITPSQFSAQVVGRETFNGSRLPMIGHEFMVAWIKRMATRYGLTTLEDNAVGVLMQELRSLVASRKEVA